MQPSEKQKPEENGSGIYLHIPFCRKACIYCNFHFSVSLKYKDQLLIAMQRELEMQRDYLEGTTIRTIYFGGGTPSLLSADEISRLTDTIYRNYTIDKIDEFTLEANPDDLSREYIKALKQTQVNRLSIGVQSFRDSDLFYMKRAHTAQQADYAIKSAQDAGITNLTIDLIYGIPGLSDRAWRENLSKVSQLGVQHFSSYALTVEEKTALNHAIAQKQSPPVDADQAAGQFEILQDFASTNGYDHYEISNLALPGYHAVHNTNYWKGKHYLGIGPSAHSFNGNGRKFNISNNGLYTKAILQDGIINAEEEILTPIQRLNEYIMTSLRTMWGCDLNYVGTGWGGHYRDELITKTALLTRQGLITVAGSIITLSNKGKLFADGIAADLFFQR